jgi:hypothetical protein
MDQSERWDEWLADADSVNDLAPNGYDPDATMARVRALHERVSRGLPEYKVTTESPEVFQDGTCLTHCRIASANSDTVGWILISNFGQLATVQDCSDPELLSRIQSLLQELGLKYIDYDYLANHIYNGKCQPLVGLSWANRYFALVVDLNI